MLIALAYIADSLSEYLELYRPIRCEFLSARRGPIFISLCLIYCLAILSLLCYSGYFFSGLSGNLAQLSYSFAQLLQRAIMPLACACWIVIALANLRIADRILDEALLGRRGSTALFRFLLSLQSGIWPMLSAWLLSCIVILALLGFAANSNPAAWLGHNQNWADNVIYNSRLYMMQLFNLQSQLVQLYGFTAICLAVACMTRKASAVWLVFGLLNLSSLLLLIDCFHPINAYAMYWQDMLYSPNLALVALSLAMASLPLLLPLLHLAGRDQPLLAAFAVLSLARAGDLFFALTGYGFIAQKQYDEMVRPLSTFFWHLNVPYKFPFFVCRPADYNAIYGMGQTPTPDYILAAMDQVRLGLHTGSWGHGLALFGNLLWLAALLWICQYSVERYEREMIT